MSIARVVPAWSPLSRASTLFLVATTTGEVEYRRLLGQAIVQLRAIRGLSQAQLAEGIGRSEAAVSRWETGKATPTAWDLREMARILELEDDQVDVLIRPPRGPVSPVAERLARAVAEGTRRGRAGGARTPAGGRAG